MFRTRMLIAAGLITLVVSFATPIAEAGIRKQMVRAINGVRRWNDLDRVRYSRRLSAGAASWARSLMRRDVLAHSARAHRHHEGEIIEWHSGAGARVRRTVTEWWESSEHRAVMLGAYRRAGAGSAVGYFGGHRCTIWVVRFGH